MSLSKMFQAVVLAVIILSCAAQAQRIRVQGNKFLVGNNPIFMLGANTPWDKWNDFGHGFDSTWWKNHFQSMHNYGMNCTRVWISCDGANASPGISATGAISAPTQAFWEHLAKLFQIAETNKIYLMLAPISFDHSKPGNPNADRWKAMYTSAANRQTFVDHYLIPLVQRFGSNPYFWSIDVGNELDWVFENHGVDTNHVFDLTARVAKGVHANSEVLVTLGTGAGPKYLSPNFGPNRYSDASLQKLQAGAYLDFYDNHFYPWMRPYFSTPFENGPATWKIDEKPCLIGEYAAKGDSTIYNPAQCLQRAYDLGWLGVMPWTSNGVDGNGSLSDFGAVFKTWSDAHRSLVFPPLIDDPGPFTITVTAPQGGSIRLVPQAAQYARGDTVKCIAVPDNGKALLRWTGDATGARDTAVLVMTRNMTVSAVFIVAGELIQNGTFDNNITPWTLGQYEGGAATATVGNNGCQISITSGGNDIWHVQLIQAGLSLEANKTYVFSFDVTATAARTIDIAVGEASGSFTKYFQQTITLTAAQQRLSFTFTPTASTTNARVEFNIGKSTTGLLLDNVSLKSSSTPVAWNATRGAADPHPFAFYHAGTGRLHLRGISSNMTIEGFTPGGRRIVKWENAAATDAVAIPLNGAGVQVIIVRGSIKGKAAFSQRVICR
ncbi:MAG: carbohydrate binding domain-containing protein [Chitinispirillaceae bacterium]|nr:carbohydrate binding domain-containing protein [Chitinispirillaceae bacterium]